MKMLSKEEVEKELGSIFPILCNCILKGLEDYVTDLGHLGWKFETHTKASIIRDQIVARVKADLIGFSNVSIFDQNGLFFLNVNEKFLIRFKKFKPNFLTSNFPTHQQRLIDWQFEDLRFK